MDLNEQYFETRKKHTQNSKGKGYILWIVVALGFLTFFVVRAVLEGRQREELIKKVQSGFSEGAIAQEDLQLMTKYNGTGVLILRNCKYQEFEDQNSLLVIGIDSSGLCYLTKRIIMNPNYPTLLSQWEEIVGSAYAVTHITVDSLGDRRIETANFELEDKGNQFVGKVRIIRNHGLIYFLQIFSYKKTWEGLALEVDKVEKSFEIED